MAAAAWNSVIVRVEYKRMKIWKTGGPAMFIQVTFGSAAQSF